MNHGHIIIQQILTIIIHHLGKENKAVGDKVQAGRPLTGMRPQPPQPQGNPQWYGNLKQPGL